MDRRSSGGAGRAPDPSRQRCPGAPVACGVAGGLLLCSAFAAPYLWFASGGEGDWLYAVLDATVIAGLLVLPRAAGRPREPVERLRALGLAVPARDLAVAVGLAAAMAGAAWLLLAHLRAQGLFFVEYEGALERRLFSLSQAFHQELFARGLLLGWLVRRGVPAGPANAGLALAFVTVHGVFYGTWSGEELGCAPAITLFCFAVSANTLLLRRGHIALGFALHAGWNVVRFGGGYSTPERWLSEGGSFAWIEGSLPAVLAALALAGLLVAWVPRAASAEPGSS